LFCLKQIIIAKLRKSPKEKYQGLSKLEKASTSSLALNQLHRKEAI